MNVVYEVFSLYLPVFLFHESKSKAQLGRNCCILDSSFRMRLQANCFSYFVQLLWSSKKVSFRSTQFPECERNHVLQNDILLSSTEDTTAICVSMPAFHVYLIALLRFLNTIIWVFCFFKKRLHLHKTTVLRILLMPFQEVSCRTSWVLWSFISWEKHALGRQRVYSLACFVCKSILIANIPL